MQKVQHFRRAGVGVAGTGVVHQHSLDLRQGKGKFYPQRFGHCSKLLPFVYLPAPLAGGGKAAAVAEPPPKAVGKGVGFFGAYTLRLSADVLKHCLPSTKKIRDRLPGQRVPIVEKHHLRPGNTLFRAINKASHKMPLSLEVPKIPQLPYIQKHCADTEYGAEYHQLPRKLVVAAHLLGHGEAGHRYGRAEHRQEHRQVRAPKAH